MELLVAASADWLKNDTTMVMVGEEIDIAKLFCSPVGVFLHAL